jgi:membrane-associated phospholipid phosphatase
MKIENNSSFINKIIFNGPYIFTIIVIFNLYKQIKYLTGFLFFFIVNGFMNKILKNIIQDPRPKMFNKINDGGRYTKTEQYGMPSGHSQSIFFAIMYSWMVTKNVTLCLFGLFMASFILYQRWEDKKHTVAQLAVGCIVGLFIGWSSYKITKKIITDYKNINSLYNVAK